MKHAEAAGQILTALAPGRCRNCGGQIAAGEPILEGPGGWGYLHPGEGCA